MSQNAHGRGTTLLIGIIIGVLLTTLVTLGIRRGGNEPPQGGSSDKPREIVSAPPRQQPFVVAAFNSSEPSQTPKVMDDDAEVLEAVRTAARNRARPPPPPPPGAVLPVSVLTSPQSVAALFQRSSQRTKHPARRSTPRAARGEPPSCRRPSVGGSSLRHLLLLTFWLSETIVNTNSLCPSDFDPRKSSHFCGFGP